MGALVVLEDGFEGEFQDWEGIGELTVPAGWTPGWVQGTEPGKNHRPEYDRETVRVHSGRAAAKVFTTHASHDGVLMRRVRVQKGLPVIVRAWGAMFRIRSGQGVQVGFHPRGRDGMAFLEEEVVWSEWWGQYDPEWAPEQFREMEARGIALESEIVVFLRSKSDYAAATVAAYFDDVEVIQEGEGEPEPGGNVLERMAAALERIAEALTPPPPLPSRRLAGEGEGEEGGVDEL